LSRSLVALAVCLFSVLGASAQDCPHPLIDRTPSYFSDDIPATDITITTATGTAKARANHNIAFIEVGPNEQKVWFGVDGNPGLHRVFYNRRTRATSSAQWYWDYKVSPAVITYAPGNSNVPGGVVYSPTARYYDSASGRYYKYMLFESFQPTACDGQVAGFLYYAFSDDGICWTEHRVVRRPGGPSPACTYLPESVAIEQVTAIDGGDRVWLVYVEGTYAPLVNVANMNRTQTYLGWVDINPPAPGNQDRLYMHSTPELTASGIFLPSNGPANASNPDRYKPYAYFMNLQMAFDPTNGYLYIGRGYPYPFDRGSNGPTDTPLTYNTPTTYQTGNGCAGAPATFPNRIQIYRKYIGTIANMGQITTGTWTRRSDSGGPLGYAFDTWPGGPASQTPLVTGQSNLNRDHGAISFLRDGAGNVVRYGTTAYYFGADTFVRSKGGNLPCRVTGTETIVARGLP
jgi:hypothetical protein